MMEELLRGIPLPALVIGANRRVLAANELANGVLIDSAAVGRNFISVLRRPALVDLVETCLSTRENGKVRCSVEDANGEVLYDAHVSAMGAKGPSDMGVILCFVDVTPNETAGQMRSDFVANVSHELRTPLTALTGFIETLRGPARDDAAAQARFLDIMDRETQRMNRLVTDLLSLSRVEDMARLAPRDHVDVEECLNTVFSSVMPLAEESRTELQLICDLDVPAPVTGDPDQLQQVFTNLIENAIKYSGGDNAVRVRLSRQDHVAAFAGPGLVVEVMDEGDGIDPKHLSRLTERFYRVDGHRSREKGGTGLGLAIVKHIINRHRGRLKITSEIGAGSVFSVYLRLADPA
ncbi:ATP-binding protein [Aliiroseovarius marinus]|uniref:ATP-binding protein n=1 Tax=Aliiroseovarius marinus TaxID=2500159 RepID=UPI003D7D9642